MAMSDEDLADLQKLLKKARQKPLAYGLCLGKKPEDNVMYLDLKKSGEVMMRKAKADGETGKVTYGEASVKGKIISLTVEGKMLPGLAKNMKMFMTKQGMKMKVVILDPDGNMLESDGDEDETPTDEDAKLATPEEDSSDANDAQEDNPLMGQWAQVSTALEPHVTRFVGSGDGKAAAVSQAWAGATAAAEKGDYKSAMAVAAKIKPLVTATPSGDGGENPAETDPNQAKWDKAVDALTALYEAAMKTNPPERSKLTAAWGMATEKAGAGDYAGALAVAARIKPLLDAAAQAGSSGQEAEVPKDVVAFQKSRVLWVGTKTKMKSEMDKLVRAIQQACADDEELAEAAQEAANLHDYLDSFDERLEDILDQITNTPEGDNRTKLKKDAVGAITAYKTALSDSFFADVDDNNGFANVAITKTANASLEKIAQVLAA